MNLLANTFHAKNSKVSISKQKALGKINISSKLIVQAVF